MVLGYVLSPKDNKKIMLSNIELSPCDKFSNIYSINKIDPNFRMRSKSDISYTYDGFVIVSYRFKIFCEEHCYIGVEFIPLPNAVNFFWFKVNNIIEYDSERRDTQFINYNKDCDGYEEIIGATPAFIKSNQPLTDNFFRTDICFGSFSGKSALYIVGEITKNKLLSAGFKELFFEKVHK